MSTDFDPDQSKFSDSEHHEDPSEAKLEETERKDTDTRQEAPSSEQINSVSSELAKPDEAISEEDATKEINYDEVTELYSEENISELGHSIDLERLSLNAPLSEIPSDKVISVDIEAISVENEVSEPSFQLEVSQGTLLGSEAPSKLAGTKSVLFADSAIDTESEIGSIKEKEESDDDLLEDLAVKILPRSVSISFTSMLEEEKEKEKITKEKGEQFMTQVLDSLASGVIVGEESIKGVDRSEESSLVSDKSLQRLIEKSKSRILSTVIEEEEEEVEIDRHMYFQMYNLYRSKLNQEKQKNSFLQKAMSAYYLHRRMFYVLKETGPVLKEVLEKYDADLDSLEQRYDESERQKEQAVDGVKRMTMKRDEKSEELRAMFEKLQQAETDYAKGLNLDESTKKYLDRLVKRQRAITTTLMEFRMEYIQLRLKMQQRTQALAHLDRLGLGFHIMDFVQLKNENQKLRDRLDDKIQELVKLRFKCQNNMQILAHNREKSNVLDLDIGNAREELAELETELHDAREQVGYYKTELGKQRRGLTKLKEENGLLALPKLLRHMEKSMNEITELKRKSEQVQTECAEQTGKVRAVRRNLESFGRAKKREAARLAEEKAGLWSDVSLTTEKEVKRKESVEGSPSQSWVSSNTDVPVPKAKQRWSFAGSKIKKF